MMSFEGISIDTWMATEMAAAATAFSYTKAELHEAWLWLWGLAAEMSEAGMPITAEQARIIAGYVASNRPMVEFIVAQHIEGRLAGGVGIVVEGGPIASAVKRIRWELEAIEAIAEKQADSE